jgi:hypothetical protein
MQRVKSEEESDKGARPARVGGPQKKEEREQRSQRVEQEVGEMIPAALQTKEAVFDEVGKSRKRKPVGRLSRGEGPCDSLERNAIPQVRVSRNEGRVVEIQEIEVSHL